MPGRVASPVENTRCGRCFFAEVTKSRGIHAALDKFVGRLMANLQNLIDFEYRARDVVDCMALALQASLLVRHAPAFVSDAFCHSRLEQSGHHHDGTLPRGIDTEAIIRRATPKSSLS